ncbi:hypothetical protein CC78DRAFT_568229 [Lojkania enalia]|uniref:Nuclear pore assembly and biogenesis-domain-containing protein n=1 Tax=Lojkania enalia TaxID=147567 RepID=A0A9P4N056_9PLEO|nr:hypothetical protein CC78DRAFT_568229 [Didymosphaeria enalia]
MDFIQGYINLSSSMLPPTIYNPLLTTITTSLSIFKTLQAYLAPLLTRITTQPDIASLLVLAALLFLSLKLLDMAYRAVMFWVKLVFKLVLWGAIMFVSLWIYRRGFDGFVEDVEELAHFWSEEYENFTRDVKKMQAQEQQWMGGYKTKRRNRW